jgi:hypothetical protein
MIARQARKARRNIMPNFDYMRVSIKGQLPGGEVWSINPCFAVPGVSEEDPGAANLLAAATAVAGITPGTALLTALSTVGNITQARIELRTFVGPLVMAGEFTRATPLVGTSNPTKPFQTSIVASLRTPFAGASNRGRLYWPYLGGALTTSGLRLDSPSNLTAATGMWTYLKAMEAAIRTATGIQVVLAVVSKKLAKAEEVMYVEVGDVADVQRRRRDKLVELRARFPAAA